MTESVEHVYRTSEKESITRTRVVRASSSATWDAERGTVSLRQDFAKVISLTEGAALTLSNYPHGLRRKADARIEGWDPRGVDNDTDSTIDGRYAS